MRFELEPVTDTGLILNGQNIDHEEIRENISEFAFSASIARQIKERVGWECEETGRKAEDGWRLEAAHDCHERNNPYYNNPCNGRCLCISAHLQQHIKILETAPDHREEWAYRSVQLIAKRAYSKGLRTEEHYFDKPLDIIDDRDEVVDILRSNNLEPEEFILW